jgi:tetratricopeptide (TPR) repeat protein
MTVHRSLCMIVRDEAEHLRRCLESIDGLFDELILVDTGSADDSKVVAASFGARLFDFRWQDDFSAARNFAKQQARGDWIMWLDADERVEEPSRARLRALLGQVAAQPMACLMRQLSGPRPDGTTLAIDHVRLFPNRSDVNWEGRIHEQLAPSLKRLGYRFQATDIVISHSGYDDPQVLAAKSRRNRALLERQRAECPDDPFTALSLGMELLSAGLPLEAVEPLEQAYAGYDQDDLLYGHLAAEVAHAYRLVGRPADAIRVAQRWPPRLPLGAPLLYQVAAASRELGDLDQAETLLRQLLVLPPPRFLPYGDLGVQGAKGRHLLAGVLWAQGRRDEATMVWRRLTVDEPSCLLGWKGLGIAALEAGDDRLLGLALEQLEAIDGGSIEALILRSQALVGSGELGQARAVLEHAVALAPGETPARLLLAQCLLRDRNHWDAAEQVLAEVLRLEPHNREAQHNLGVLRRRRQTSPTAGSDSCA